MFDLKMDNTDSIQLTITNVQLESLDFNFSAILTLSDEEI